MRNFKWMGLFICLIIPFLQSCLNDSESWPEGTNLAIATVRIKETTEQHNFYFLLDNNKTINPVTLKHKDYKAIEGQRAFVYFGMIDNKSVISDENYDYNANIFYIENILTKDIISLSEVDKDSIGNDLLDITKVWIAQGYLNVECRYYSLNSDNKHLLNMVYHEVDDEGYICLEFKHNAFHDYGTYARNGLISFKLDNVMNEMTSAKGIKIYTNTYHYGIQSYILNLENHTR